ncbi:hypothetical protein XCR_4033 [Xanthomonas campestris pv. raphani 756C]|nr:hypothetical protein XCR_4033 [Xanthomonas campestris pv. raphani 756C]
MSLHASTLSFTCNDEMARNEKGPIVRSDLSCLAAPDGFEPPNA